MTVSLFSTLFLKKKLDLSKKRRIWIKYREGTLQDRIIRILQWTGGKRSGKPALNLPYLHDLDDPFPIN